jgi:hypothetical protein
MLKLIMVLLYMMTEWFDWMNPMPPISAARLNTWSTPWVVNKVAEHVLSHVLIFLLVGGDDVMALALQTASNV